MAERRKFQASKVPTKKVVVPHDMYAGTLTPTIMSKNGSMIRIEPKEEWDNSIKDFVKFPGEFMLRASIILGVTLTSQKAKKILGQDDPKTNGFLQINFSQETDGEYEGTSEIANSPALGQFQVLVGITEEVEEGVTETLIDLNEEIDWEHDDDIEVPADMQGYKYAVQMLNDKLYYEALFGAMCAYGVNLDVMAEVFDKAPRGKNKGKPDNGVACTNDSLGLMPYVEGSELDLED